ncbi:ribonuclease H-like domain-containing protein [Tanacetum coccineum]
MGEPNPKYNRGRIREEDSRRTGGRFGDQSDGRNEGQGGQVGSQGREVNAGVDGVNGVPDFSTIIAQQLQNLLPTIVVQVGDQGRGQGIGRNQNGDAANDHIRGDVRNVMENNDNMGCTYKEFLACNPKEYDGKGGDVIRTLGREVAVGMSWDNFKNYAIVGAGHAVYTDRFHELARLVPHLVTPENRRIKRDNNCTIKFDAFGFSVNDFLTRHILLRCDSSGDLYLVTKSSTTPAAFLSTSASTWHQRLGHSGDEVLPWFSNQPLFTRFLALLCRKWPIHQLDVKNAFLNGDLSETRSLYGMKQAPCAWFQRVVGYATWARFYHSRCDSLMFIYRQGSQFAYLLIYVDDIIITASCPTYFSTIIGFVFVTEEVALIFLNAVLLTWGLPYLTFIRPDLSYAVQQICLYMHDPREPHFAALKRILLYVQGTMDIGLQLYVSTNTPLVSYTDANWAGCPSTRSAVYMSANPVQHQRTKLIKIDIHFVCDMVTAGHVRVLYVPSRYQYADIFTKGLPSALFEDFRSSLSVLPPTAPTAGRISRYIYLSIYFIRIGPLFVYRPSPSGILE